MRRSRIDAALDDGTVGRICALYEAILGRRADVPGLLHFVDRVARGTSLDAVAATLRASGEARRSPSDPDSHRPPHSLAGDSLPRHPEEAAERLSRRTYEGGACFETRPPAAPQHDKDRDVHRDSAFRDAEVGHPGSDPRDQPGRLAPAIAIGGEIALDDRQGYALWAAIQAHRLRASGVRATGTLHVVVPVASLRELPALRATLRTSRGADVRRHVLAPPRLAGLLRWPMRVLGSGTSVRGADFVLGDLAGLAASPDDIVCLVRPGDAVSARELRIAAATRPDAGLLLSDGDALLASGETASPRLRAGWDPELETLRAPVGAVVVRAPLAGALAGSREPLSDFALQGAAARLAGEGGIAHLPFVLYHRRGAGPEAPSAPHPLPLSPPLVSVVIPTRDQPVLLARCVASLRGGSAPREIVVVDNGSRRPETHELLRRLEGEPDTIVLRDESPFNWSRLNDLGIRSSRGEVVVLLNDDVEATSPEALDRLVAEAMRPEVGIAGPKLLYPEGDVQHAGIAFAEDDVWHVWRHASGSEPGHLGMLSRTRQVSAVTGACMAFRREVYEEVGGFEMDLPVTFGDTDLCLRIRRASYRAVFTPHAVLVHVEQASRGSDTASRPNRERYARERERFLALWSEAEREERFLSPHLHPGSPSPRLRFD